MLVPRNVIYCKGYCMKKASCLYILVLYHVDFFCCVSNLHYLDCDFICRFVTCPPELMDEIRGPPRKLPRIFIEEEDGLSEFFLIVYQVRKMLCFLTLYTFGLESRATIAEMCVLQWPLILHAHPHIFTFNFVPPIHPPILNFVLFVFSIVNFLFRKITKLF